MIDVCRHSLSPSLHPLITACCLSSSALSPLKPCGHMDPWNLQFPPLQTHSHMIIPIYGVGQQVYWILMISEPASPWLISGCRFSVVYLILSFCLHPFIISPNLPAFVRNEGGHLPSVPPSPSSLSSQTTVVAGVRLWKWTTLFACARVCVCARVCMCACSRWQGSSLRFWTKSSHNIC